MSVTATRNVQIVYTGDVVGTETLSAASNTSSAGSVQILALASGANTISVPTGGTVPTAVTIVPPSGNTVTLTLKGVTGDTGVALHLTDPTSIALASSVTTFVITTNNTVNLRLYWS